MRLTDIFFGDRQTNSISESGVNTQDKMPASGQALNQLLSELVPGQLVSGELVDANGSNVAIKLLNNMTLNAKLNQNVVLEMGKNITFEVRGTGDSITLSPLFTNTASEQTIEKALDMASLPVTEDSGNMVRAMMQAGLSIDKSSLQDMYHEINSYGADRMVDIVNLHKLGLPVNDKNIDQMNSYRNLSYKLMDGLNEVFKDLPEIVQRLVNAGEIGRAEEFVQSLENTMSEEAWEGLGPEKQIPGESSEMGEGREFSQLHDGGNPDDIDNAPNTFSEKENRTIFRDNVPDFQNGVDSEQDVSPKVVSKQMLSKGEPVDTDISGTENKETIGVSAKHPQNSFGDEFLSSLKSIMGKADNSKEAAVPLVERLSVVLEKLKGKMSIAPEDLEDEGSVEKLYKSLDKQLKGIAKGLEDVGQADTNAYRATTNLSQNIDFLNQINQAYTYVQLPLRLRQGETNGDLYVYTNKRNLAVKDGDISALLHLDMANLGPLDVYVKMSDVKVSTKFYVKDDEILDFIEAHMDQLTERLQRRGYNCDVSMQKRDENKLASGGIDKLVDDGGVKLSEFSFDVRT